MVSRTHYALIIFAVALMPWQAYAAGDLTDLYDAVHSKGRTVTIPAQLVGRLKLGSPAADLSGKEITVAKADGDKRGITAFELAGVPTITMFHVEPVRDDAWLIRFSLDGQILNQEWEEGGYRTYAIKSEAVAEAEIGFWRDWVAAKPRQKKQPP